MRGTLWLLLFLLSSSALFAKGHTVYVIPCGRQSLAPSNWTYSTHIPRSRLTSWQLLDHALEKRGMKLHFGDLSDIRNFKDLDCVISVNLPTWTKTNWEKKFRKIRKHHIPIYLVAFEPPSVLPKMYSQKVLALFDKMLTWNDSLVDRKKTEKFYYPCQKPFVGSSIPFSKKRLLTMICGNKSSSHPHELYSERRKVIQYFEKHRQYDFQFFGRGWQKQEFSTWGGSVESKLTTLQKFRFSICYENICDIDGYITEKIFDCFEAGSVPIYWGARNIKKHIREGCFISREDFATFDDLVHYLANMDEKVYNTYLHNIQSYLQSEKAKKFTRENFVRTLLDCAQIP
jgi:alpha(1,3/1,4) fucosyltransferase